MEEAFEMGIDADEFLNIVIQKVDEKKKLMNKRSVRPFGEANRSFPTTFIVPEKAI